MELDNTNPSFTATSSNDSSVAVKTDTDIKSKVEKSAPKLKNTSKRRTAATTHVATASALQMPTAAGKIELNLAALEKSPVYEAGADTGKSLKIYMHAGVQEADLKNVGWTDKACRLYRNMSVIYMVLNALIDNKLITANTAITVQSINADITRCGASAIIDVDCKEALDKLASEDEGYLIRDKSTKNRRVFHPVISAFSD